MSRARERYPASVERAIAEADGTLTRRGSKFEARVPWLPAMADIPPFKVPLIAKGSRPPSGMNKLESDWAMVLEAQKYNGEIKWWMYQPMSFNLGNGAKYRPDFGVLKADNEYVLYETKGHWREAARVRIKVASAMHPFRFIAITRVDGAWKEERF